jgi:hypothetical protein
MTGVLIHARHMLPMNVRGTAPGKTKWSYYLHVIKTVL